MNNLETQQYFGYSSEVSLRILHGDYEIKKQKIKNQGFKRLFFGICQFLQQRFKTIDLTSYCPRFLSVGKEADTLSVDATSLKSEFKINSRFLLRNNGTFEEKEIINDKEEIIGYYTMFSAQIPYTTIGDEEIKEIGLFSDINPKSEDLLARIVLTDTTEDNWPISLSEGQTLIIEWKMTFTNK